MKPIFKVLIGVGFAGIIVTGIFFIYKKTNKNKSDAKNSNKTTESDFDKIVEVANSTGKDVFKDLKPEQLQAMKEKFMQNFSKSDVEIILSILPKKESEMTTAEKSKIISYLNRIK